MRNRFNATCACCGRTVLVGDGDTNLNDFGRWVTKHTKCPPKPEPVYQPRFDDYDDSYEMTGMTDADWRDALNPDEGDKG
jgi:hypothetical protein